MDELGMTTLEKVLANAQSLPRWAVVCFPELSPVAGEDPCLVADGRQLDEDEDVPPEARRDGLTRTLSAPQVVDILDNVHRQLANPTQVQLIDALNCYIVADTFVSFAEDPPSPHGSDDTAPR